MLQARKTSLLQPCFPAGFSCRSCGVQDQVPAEALPNSCNNAKQRPENRKKIQICEENTRGREKGRREKGLREKEKRCRDVRAQQEGSQPRGRGEGTAVPPPPAGGTRSPGAPGGHRAPPPRPPARSEAGRCGAVHGVLFPCAGADRSGQ